MPYRKCCVKECLNNNNKKSGGPMSFFKFPKPGKVVPGVNSSVREKELAEKRIMAWCSQIFDQVSPVNVCFDSVFVCSDHFSEGKPARYFEVNHVDWIPTLKMGHTSVKEPNPELSIHREPDLESEDQKRRRTRSGAILPPPPPSKETPAPSLGPEPFVFVDVTPLQSDIGTNKIPSPPAPTPNDVPSQCTKKECSAMVLLVEQLKLELTAKTEALNKCMKELEELRASNQESMDHSFVIEAEMVDVVITEDHQGAGVLKVA